MKKKEIKYLFMDVDGTLTDGRIYIGNQGEICKAFHVKDGCGIHDILIQAGIEPVIMTGRTSRIVEERCREIGIKMFYQGVSDKRKKLSEILDAAGCSGSQSAYIGDDINDLTCMEFIKKAGGLTGCPADAVQRVKERADYVCKVNGGHGAVREFIEWIWF